MGRNNSNFDAFDLFISLCLMTGFVLVGVVVGVIGSTMLVVFWFEKNNKTVNLPVDDTQ